MTAAGLSTTPGRSVPEGWVAGTWVIDPAHTVVIFSVRHLMSRVRGTFSEVSGQVVTSPGLSGSTAGADIAVSSVSTGNQMRDDHLRSADFFDAERYPVMTFASSALRPVDGGWVLSSELTIRDVTRPVDLEVEFLGTDPTGLQGEPRIGFRPGERSAAATSASSSAWPPTAPRSSLPTRWRLFPGRFLPAAGHGVAACMGQLGAQARSPMTLLREWVTAARSLLHGDTVTVSGGYVRLDHVALDWPPSPAPPLLVGARGPRTLALAGEISDGLVLDAGTFPAGVRRAVAAARRPQEVVVYLLCGGPGSAERLQAELRPSAEPLADRAAIGSASDIGDTIHAFTRAGATAVIPQPAVEEPDIAATIQLAGAARTQYLNDHSSQTGAFPAGPRSNGVSGPVMSSGRSAVWVALR